MTTTNHSPVALVSGAGRGLGRALARALHDEGWRVLVDARNGVELDALTSELASVVAVPGDVTDPQHRAALATVIADFGRLDLLVNNASSLGASPLPPLAAYPLGVLRELYETNLVAPLALIQLLLPTLRASRATVLNISSDAAVEAYPGWGGYGSSKAALDQVSAVLGAEEPELRVYALDPGDMRTAMHQAAFPGEDISDRPTPETVVPALLRLLRERPASGRYRAGEWAVAGAAR